MIVQPDFCDHWKTALLVQLTDDTAVICLLRFWSHCQNRRQWQFENLTPSVLAAVCKWRGEPETWWNAMAQTFLDIEGNTVTAHEWDEVNSSLIAAWERGKYGAKGGRPTKTSKVNGENHTGYDTETSMAPLVKPDKIEKIDKSRERKESAAPTLLPQGVVIPDELDTPQFRKSLLDYLQYRRERKLSVLKPMSFKAKFNEFIEWGVDQATQALNESVANGWQGVFKPKPDQAAKRGAGKEEVGSF